MKSAAKSGIRAIAIYEACKGIVGLVACFGLLSLINRDLVDFAEDLIGVLHLNTEGRLAHRIVETIAKLNPTNIKIFSIIALLYATKQFVEAYGLWRLRAWAEWVAIISGLVYIPVEIYELIHKPTFTRAAILIFNIGIVVYLYSFRKEQKHETEVIEKKLQTTAPDAKNIIKIN